MQVSIATIVTAEQVASFLAGGNTTAGYAIANAFLRYVTANAGGEVMARLENNEWVSAAIPAAAQSAGAPPPAGSKVPVVVEAIVLINKRLTEVRGAGDGEKLLIGWAKTAHVADVAFSDAAASFAKGDLDEAAYRCAQRVPAAARCGCSGS